MMKTMTPRLRVPITMAILGTAIAIASGVSSGWTAALIVEAFVVVCTIGFYVLGGRDSDLGADIGSRADERQATIQLRASALTVSVTALVAVIGFVIQTARGANTSSFALFACVIAVTYLVGFVIYRDRP
jgi:hypothetical protein